jgi:hypothetical protein
MTNYEIINNNVESVNNKVEPILELYRGKLYCYIIKLFITDCVNIFGYKIFSIKKSVSRTITNLLSSWILSMYIDYDYSGDYFFPNNFSNTDTLKDTLLDLSKYDKTLIDVNNKINILINRLIKNYKYQLYLLSEYKISQQFNYNKNNYNITKSLITIKKTNFYKFNITSNIIIKDNRLINILNNILLPTDVYDKMILNYKINNINNVDNLIWAIVYRYQLLGSNNHQLGVLPNILNKMKDDYNLNFECFASSINFTFPNYCSIYYDIEKYFGSQGNFFRIIPIKGTYSFNPPYQKHIMDISIHKLFYYLDNTQECNNLTFIITIPIWDIEGQTIMSSKQYTTQSNHNIMSSNQPIMLSNQNIIDYGDFDIINKIKISKYFKGLRMIPKEDFTYMDHNFNLYKNKTIQNTYIIVLSNQDIDINKINNYNFNI